MCPTSFQRGLSWLWICHCRPLLPSLLFEQRRIQTRVTGLALRLFHALTLFSQYSVFLAVVFPRNGWNVIASTKGGFVEKLVQLRRQPIHGASYGVFVLAVVLGAKATVLSCVRA